MTYCPPPRLPLARYVLEAARWLLSADWVDNVNWRVNPTGNTLENSTPEIRGAVLSIPDRPTAIACPLGGAVLAHATEEPPPHLLTPEAYIAEDELHCTPDAISRQAADAITLAADGFDFPDDPVAARRVRLLRKIMIRRSAADTSPYRAQIRFLRELRWELR